MSVQTIKITTDRLSGDVNSFSEKIRVIQNSLNAIEESLSRLNNMWEGNAKQAFTSIVEEDLTEAKEILSEMSGLCSYDENAVQKYEACEREIENLITLVRV